MISGLWIANVNDTRSWRKAIYQHLNLSVYSVFAVFLVLAVALAKGAKFSEFLQIVKSLCVPVIGTMIFFSIMLGYYALLSVVEAIRAKTGMGQIGVIFDRKISVFIGGDLFAQGLIGVIPLSLVTIVLDVGKSLIVYTNPYHWDPFFSHLDKVFHFGVYPHQLLMPVIEQLHLLEILNIAYILWFFVMFLVNGLCLFCDRDMVRRQKYLWSVVLSWTLCGVVCATIFSSVGPIFFHDFYPQMDDPYKELINYLRFRDAHGTPLSVISISHILLDMSRNNSVIDLNGPSAMPSMHIAAAWLMVLYGFSVNRWAAAVALIYFLLLFAGSICLSWHYAIDGYASIVLVSILWILSGWLVRNNLTLKD